MVIFEKKGGGNLKFWAFLWSKMNCVYRSICGKYPFENFVISTRGIYCVCWKNQSKYVIFGKCRNRLSRFLAIMEVRVFIGGGYLPWIERWSLKWQPKLDFTIHQSYIILSPVGIYFLYPWVLVSLFNIIPVGDIFIYVQRSIWVP